MAKLSKKEAWKKYGKPLEVLTAGTGLFPEFIISQMFLETGGFDSELNLKYNNFGGHKAHSLVENGEEGTDFVTMKTNEEFKTQADLDKFLEGDGKGYTVHKKEVLNDGTIRIKIDQPFKIYSTPEEGLLKQVEFYTKSPKRYKEILKAQSPEEQLKMVFDAGYATDSTYVDSVGDIMKEMKPLVYAKGEYYPEDNIIKYKDPFGEITELKTLDEYKKHSENNKDEFTPLPDLPVDMFGGSSPEAEQEGATVDAEGNYIPWWQRDAEGPTSMPRSAAEKELEKYRGVLDEQSFNALVDAKHKINNINSMTRKNKDGEDVPVSQGFKVNKNFLKAFNDNLARMDEKIAADGERQYSLQEFTEGFVSAFDRDALIKGGANPGSLWDTNMGMRKWKTAYDQIFGGKSGLNTYFPIEGAEKLPSTPPISIPEKGIPSQVTPSAPEDKSGLIAPTGDTNLRLSEANVGNTGAGGPSGGGPGGGLGKTGAGILGGLGLLADSALGMLAYSKGEESLAKAIKDIPIEERSQLDGAWKGYMAKMKRLSESGLSPEEKASAKNDLSSAYNLGVKNVMRASGGSRASFLANAGVLNANRVKGLLKLTAMDATVQRKNMEQYGRSLEYQNNFIQKEDEIQRNKKYEEATRSSAVHGMIGATLMGQAFDTLSSVKENVLNMGYNATMGENLLAGFYNEDTKSAIEDDKQNMGIN